MEGKQVWKSIFDFSALIVDKSIVHDWVFDLKSVRRESKMLLGFDCLAPLRVVFWFLCLFLQLLLRKMKLDSSSILLLY